MQKASGVRGFSLRGSSLGPKVRVRKKKNTPEPARPSTPADAGGPALVVITSVDALVKELRKSLHAMFSCLDPNIPTTNLYDNCSQQAFRYFTTTNTITPEAFHHKINKIGLLAPRKLCLELFSLVDQDDLGELTYATFAHRIFLPAGYFNFSRPRTPTHSPRPTSATKSRPPTREGAASPTGPSSPWRLAAASASATPRVSTPRRPDAGGSFSPIPLVYELMNLADIEKCVSRKLEERTSRGTDRFRQAFRLFTKSEGISFADFHHHLSALQIHLSAAKCRALFERFDSDRNGTIDLAELTATLFRHEENEVALLSSRPASAHRTPHAAHHHHLSLEDFEVEAGSSLTIQEILAKLRDKLEQHTSKETDRFRQAFRIFSKSSGITPHEFNAAMAKLGLKLNERQVRELFELFDFDKSGDLNLNEFVQGVMLDEHSTKHWYSIKDKHKMEESRRMLYSMAVQSVQDSWTIGDIERMLREKIEQRTSRSNDCFRQAFRIFGKVNGIRPAEFHAALETIGLALDRSQSDVLFQRFDKNGSGDIDLDEFIHGVLPPDYTGRQWVAAADELHREAELQKKQDALMHPDRFMTEIEMESWSLDEIEKRIRDKIQQATSKSSDTFRQAYKIFKKSNHVTMDEFRERLLALGFRLTPAQCRGLFQRYDTNNSNDIDLQEFCMRVLPPDYTGEGDYWSHSDKFHKHREREKLEYVKRSKNGLLLLPKFDESRVRYTRGQHESRSFADLESEPDESQPSMPVVDLIRPAAPVSRPDTPRGRQAQPPNQNDPQRPSSAAFSSHKLDAGEPTEGMVSPRTRNLQRPPTPQSSPRASRPLSPRASKASVSSSHSGNNSPQRTATPPPPSARPMSPRQPRQPNPASGEASSGSPRRPMTPRAAAMSSPRPPVEYEDEEVDEFVQEDTEERDDDKGERLTSHALRVLRARRAEAAQRHRHHHHHHHHDHTEAADATPRRPGRGHRDAAERAERGSVGGESFSSTVQRAVGGAKYTPTRSNMLLMQRFMRATAKRQAAEGGGTGPSRPGKQVADDARHASKSKRPHTTRV